jgi:hypothetical protein
MIKIPNKLVIFGAVAAAALVVPGIIGPLVSNEAYAEARASNRAGDALVNLQVAAAVEATDVLNDNQVTACIIVSECRAEN